MTSVYFASEKKSDGIELIGKPPTMALVISEGDNWRAVKTHQSFSSGRHYVEIEILKDANTTNTWRIVVGAVPSSFDCTQRSYTCVGSQQGGWGYVGGTGKKYRKAHGEASAYGPTYTTGDVIGILLDFPKKSISFFKNKQGLGAAFSDLSGAVHIAISLTAKDAKVCIRESLDPESKDNLLASEKERFSQLEADFFNKFNGSHIDVSHPFFAVPLAELTAMGFSHMDSLEALLVTGDAPSDHRSSEDLSKAIDYLFSSPETRKARYDEAAKLVRAGVPLFSLFGGSTSSASSTTTNQTMFSLSAGTPSVIDAKLRDQFSHLRKQVDAERRQHETERKAFDRELYKETLAVCIADELLNRQKLEKLEELRVKKRISKEVHEQILYELGISKEKYAEFMSKARDDEELLRRLKKDTKTSKFANSVNECVVCIEKPAEFVILDCMHVCLCEGCRCLFSTPNSLCPSCRRPVKEVRKVY